MRGIDPDIPGFPGLPFSNPVCLNVPLWLLYAMARHLDPKLQKIIEDESRNVQSSDTPHPSVLPNDFTHTPLNRHLGHRQSTEEPSFLANGFQTTQSVLDDFGTELHIILLIQCAISLMRLFLCRQEHSTIRQCLRTFRFKQWPFRPLSAISSYI